MFSVLKTSKVHITITKHYWGKKIFHARPKPT